MSSHVKQRKEWQRAARVGDRARAVANEALQQLLVHDKLNAGEHEYLRGLISHNPHINLSTELIRFRGRVSSARQNTLALLDRHFKTEGNITIPQPERYYF